VSGGLADALKHITHERLEHDVRKGQKVCGLNDTIPFGVVEEYPAVDPDGVAHDDLVAVEYLRGGGFDNHDISEVRVVTTVVLPEPVEDWHGGLTMWRVPLHDSFTGRLLDGPRAGEVCIRKSDGNVSVTSVPSLFTHTEDLRVLAAALLAAADARDAGVRAPEWQR
jgi:hypothetical protein